MATVPLPNSKPTKTPVEEPPVPVTPSERVTERQKSERRGLSRWLVLVVICGIGVYFLPDLVARTSLRQVAPQLLFPGWTGSIELGETSLGWFTPINIRDIKLTDRAGQTLATVEHLRSSATLCGLITHPRALGEFHLAKTVVHVHLEDGHPNWETPLAELAGKKSASSSNPAQWKLLFPEAQVLVSGQSAEAGHTLQNLDVKVAMGEVVPTAITVEVSFPPENGQPEPSLLLTTTLVADAVPSIKLTARDFDLARLEGLSQLVSPLGVVRGRLSGTLTAEASASDGSAWVAESDLQGKGMTAAGWPILAGDVLQLEETVLRGKLIRAADRLECENVRLQTDFAKLSAQGICRWPGEMTTPATADAALQAFGDDFQLTATLDAAKAAQRLPNSLRLKSGVAITSGQIQATLQTIKDEKGRALDGNARFSDLAATIDGHQRRWTAPLDADILLRPSADGLECDRLALRSDFCTVLGQGTPSAAKFRVTADLDRLWQEIAPLVDWQGASLAGTAKLDGSIKRHDAGSVVLHVDGQGDGIRYGSVEQPIWSESRLTLALDVTGQGPAASPWTTITAGSIDLKSGSDHCEVKLLKPFEWIRTDATVPVSLGVAGDWARWQQRLRPIWHDPEMKIAGNGQLTATMSYSPDVIEFKTATLKSQPLQVTLPAWQVADAAFETTLQGTWDVKSRTWTTPRTTAKGEWGEITWTDGRYALNHRTGNLAGRLDLDVNVGRVSRWQQGDVQRHLLGQLAGTVDLRPSNDTLQGDVDLHMTNVVLAGLSAEPQPRWIAQWREPDLTVKGRLQQRTHTTAWDLASLQLSASGVAVSTSGRIDPRADCTEVDLRGQLVYDWDQLMSRVDPSWAQRIKLTGRGDRPFSVKGTMRPAADGSVSIADLTGEGQLTWDQATVYGLPLTASNLSARFAQGQGQLGPVDLSVAQGTVHLAPQLDFRQQALVTLPVGRIVDRVQLTPAVCQQLLKYALPLGADAAEMDGAFSLDVDENVWPLATPQAGKARGSLTIHRARIAPGPLAARLTGVIDQVRAVLERRNPSALNPNRLILDFPEQTVALAQMNGRVYHDRMTVRVDNIDLVTGGSVGFDETLQLTFLLPIQEKWVRGTPGLAKMAGQSLRIPVTGTLSQPQVDPSILAQLAQQAAGSTIEKAIDDTVQKQLERFLPRRN